MAAAQLKRYVEQRTLPRRSGFDKVFLSYCPPGLIMKMPYEIETEQDSIVIRLPRELANDEGLVRFLDYLEMQDIRQRSELSEEDAEKLAAEVKRDAWQRVRHLFQGEGAE